MKNGGTLENAQRMAAHSSSKTTSLYVRTSQLQRLLQLDSDQMLWFRLQIFHRLLNPQLNLLTLIRL